MQLEKQGTLLRQEQLLRTTAIQPEDYTAAILGTERKKMSTQNFIPSKNNF